MSTEYLTAIRSAVRLSSEIFDSEIKDLIAAARSDLQLSGITKAKVEDEEDALIKRAIILYVRAEFNLEPEYADNYRNAYQSLKISLALSADYTEGTVND